MAYVKPEDVVENMLQAGAKKAGLSVKDLLIRGALSGAFLGYATTLAITAITQTGLGIVGAIIFPVGFVMIILLGLELATGNFALIPIAVKDGRTSIAKMAYNWTWVLIGNLIGGLLYAFLYYVVITRWVMLTRQQLQQLKRLLQWLNIRHLITPSSDLMAQSPLLPALFSVTGWLPLVLSWHSPQAPLLERLQPCGFRS